jgi:rSAM/selenodomain-associated transferase 1
MESNAPRPELRVGVFAKAPVAGEVKTRLAGVLPGEGAAELHRLLVRRALAVATAARVGPVTLHCAPDTKHSFFAECAARFGVTLEAQVPGDLGARMWAAFAPACADGGALILVGSDCPALEAGDIRAAADALRTNDAVFAPAEDGGYVLIGLARANRQVFDGIEWGGELVMAQTRAALLRAGMRHAELRTLWDVDRPEDYARLAASGLLAEVST